MKYSTFKKWLFETKLVKNKPKREITIIIYYIIANILIALLGVIFVFTIVALKTQMSKMEEFPSSKYRKVVKKGLFFDSIEYHER